MKPMEKINAVVKAAQESKVDSMHKLGLALESIANDIERSAKDLKAVDRTDVANCFDIWYYRGKIASALYAFKSVVICGGLSDTPDGAETLKISEKEVEYYA